MRFKPSPEAKHQKKDEQRRNRAQLIRVQNHPKLSTDQLSLGTQDESGDQAEHQGPSAAATAEVV